MWDINYDTFRTRLKGAGFGDTDINKILNIAPTIFYKYKRVESIATSELKDNRYKQSNNKQGWYNEN